MPITHSRSGKIKMGWCGRLYWLITQHAFPISSLLTFSLWFGEQCAQPRWMHHNKPCFSYTFLLSVGHKQHNPSNDTLVECVRLMLFLGKVISSWKGNLEANMAFSFLPWPFLEYECRGGNCSDHPLIWGNGKEKQSPSFWHYTPPHVLV